MPFKSKAQAGYLHSHPEILGKEGLAEWDAATKGKHLPERKMKKHKKHKMAETHIKHHADGSHTKKHTMDDGSEVTSAHPDDADMMGQMQEALGSGQEAPAAAPAAAPAGMPTA
jgi:hypothetical protein